MSSSLRVALLLDPLSVSLTRSLGLRIKWGRHAQEIARELLGRGHTVRGFGAPPGLIPSSSELEFDGSRSGGSKLAAFAPEVLLAYDALSPAAFRAARMARKHGSTVVCVESTLPSDGPWPVRLRGRVGEWMWGRYVRRTAAALIALDPLSRERALAEGFDEGIIRVVRHGVDVRQFRPGLTSTLVARHRIRGRILLYVGKLSANRGVDVLIDAFARTVGQRADWNLVVCGDGTERPALRAQVDRLGIADRTHWLTRPNEAELPGLMGASTLMAVPALDDTVLGTHIRRALACGLPLIASASPRFAGLVVDDETGLTAAPGDVEAWTEALRRAASSPAARKRWSESGRRLAEEELSWPIIADRFETVFHEALERSARTAAETKADSTRPHEV